MHEFRRSGINSMRRLILTAALLGSVALLSAQSLTITPANPTIQIGQSIQLAANGPRVQWSISDPLVATLTPSGLITGRSVGKAIVFALAKNGKEGSTTVTVVDVPPPPPPAEVCGDGIDNDGDGLIDENPPCAPPPPPPTSARGPQPTITCPAGSLDVFPGSSLQAAINTGAPVVCIRAGVHPVSGSVVPKSGMTFIGEYGAILDGSGWSTSDEIAGAFQAVNTNVDNVTIRNLVIRNMPTKGVIAMDNSHGWTLENNDIGPSEWGFVLSANATVRRNKLHHASIGGYSSYLTRTVPGSVTIFEDNEVFNNASQTKFQDGGKHIVRLNHYHDQIADSIWFDGDANGSIIEDNLIERSGRIGIHIEMVVNAAVRNNTIRHSGDHAVFVSTTRDSIIENNRLEENFRGVTLYLTCLSLDQGWEWAPDLRNNTIRNNSTRTTSGAIAALFTYSGDCTAARLQPYLDNTKANWYSGNSYQTPDSTGWWYWVTPKTWAQWQALGQDATGTVSQ